MTDALKTALDRFDVPPLSAGRADKIMTAATGARPIAVPEPRRRFDRRGAWRRGRQVVIGSLAVGLLSATAVASGLLGKVGIEVPVLTAMLAPEPKPAAKPVKRAPSPARRAEVPAPVEVPAAVPQQALLPRPLLPTEWVAQREARRERREAFAAKHPVIAARVEQRVREELRLRAEARRAAIGADAGVPLLPEERRALARAAIRDRLVAERIIDRRIVAQQERQARIDAMTPEQRAALRQRWQERRAQRLERERVQAEVPAADAPTNSAAAKGF